MKKVILQPNEQVIERIRFAKRIFLIDILFLVAILTTAARLGQGSIISLILLILFFPLLVKSLLDFYRINFHRVYITNIHLIYVKGFYLKRIAYYNIADITEILIKSSILDFNKILTTYKLLLKEDKKVILRNILNGDKIGKLLSSMMNNQQ